MRILGGALAAATLCVVAMGRAPARAATGPSFNGTCDFGGVEALFDPPLAAESADVRLSLLGLGECTGLLNGTPVAKRRTTVDIDLAGRANCLGTDGNMLGTAVFRFGTPEALDVDMVFRLDPTAFVKVGFAGETGRARGTGLALVTVSGEVKPLLEYDLGCFTGAVCELFDVDCRTQRRAAIDFEIVTDGTTLTSRVRGAAPPPAPAPRRTPRFASVLPLPEANRCGLKRMLRFRAHPAWREKVRSIRVTARGRTRTDRAAVTIAGPRTGKLTVAVQVRLRDGRAVQGQRRFRACR